MNKAFKRSIAWVAVLAVCLSAAFLQTPTVYADTGGFLDTATQLIEGIPNMHLFMFGGGLIACILGLIIMQIAKNRKRSYYDDED